MQRKSKHKHKLFRWAIFKAPPLWSTHWKLSCYWSLWHSALLTGIIAFLTAQKPSPEQGENFPLEKLHIGSRAPSVRLLQLSNNPEFWSSGFSGEKPCRSIPWLCFFSCQNKVSSALDQRTAIGSSSPTPALGCSWFLTRNMAEQNKRAEENELTPICY